MKKAMLLSVSFGLVFLLSGCSPKTTDQIQGEMQNSVPEMSQNPSETEANVDSSDAVNAELDTIETDLNQMDEQSDFPEFDENSF